MNYKISVITPSLNSARYIERAIDSVLAQDYPNFEHVVVDAVSTDGTIEILKKYPHLKWISEPDKGQSDAMNKGFTISSGDIIVYLNTDDYLLPGAFKSVEPYFEKGAKFVVGKVKVITKDGRSWINNPRVKHQAILKHWEPEAFSVNPVGYYYLREVQENIGGFNVDNNFAMDLEFLMAASQKYNFTKIESVLGVFNYIEDTKTAKTQSKLSYWTEQNLAFVNKFLENMPEDFIKEYKKERKKGYRKRTLITIWLHYREAIDKKDVFPALYWGLVYLVYRVQPW